MSGKKYPPEKIILTAAFSLAALCCVSIIVFPQLRHCLFNFALKHAPRAPDDGERTMLQTLILVLPSAGLVICGIFLFFLHCEKSILAFLKNNYFPTAYFGVSVIALFIRICGFQFASIDYNVYVFKWLEYLSRNGHFFGIAAIKSDYFPFYLYILSLISLLPEYLWLPCVKIVSCVFDFLLAIIVRKLVLNICGRKPRALIVFSCVLFCPTVFFNSGTWAQCESIYSSFVFLSLLLFLEKKASAALFFFGLALSIKLQAIFIFPFIVLLYFDGAFSFGKVFYFFVGLVSAAVIGLPFGAHIQMLRAYFAQMTGYADSLTSNAPSVFSLFAVNNNGVAILGRIGIIFTLAILFGIFLLFIYRAHNNPGGDDAKRPALTYITLFFFCALIVPFFLPRMHERYFYLAEIAAILYAVVVPKRWYIPLLVIIPSCGTYFNFLFGSNIPLVPLGVILFFAVILVMKWTIQTILSKGPVSKPV